MDLFGIKKRKAATAARIAEEEAATAARNQAQREHERAVREVRERVRRQLDGLPDYQVTLLLCPSEALSDQVANVLKLGVGPDAAEIRD